MVPEIFGYIQQAELHPRMIIAPGDKIPDKGDGLFLGQPGENLCPRGESTFEGGRVGYPTNVVPVQVIPIVLAKPGQTRTLPVQKRGRRGNGQTRAFFDHGRLSLRIDERGTIRPEIIENDRSSGTGVPATRQRQNARQQKRTREPAAQSEAAAPTPPKLPLPPEDAPQKRRCDRRSGIRGQNKFFHKPCGSIRFHS